MISQTAEYALRAIVYLAGQELPQTTQQIAATTRVPAGYLSKVLQALARGGLVHSQRGLHGGFTLAAGLVPLRIQRCMRRPLPASPVYIRLFESMAIICARMNSPAWRPGLPNRSRIARSFRRKIQTR